MKIYVKAYDIARSADLKALKQYDFGKILCDNPLIFKSSRDRYLVVFDYGVVVFFDYQKEEIVNAIANIKSNVIGYKKIYAKDDYTLIVKGKKIPVTVEEMALGSLDLDHVKIVSTVLSRSVALEYYENIIDDSLGRLSGIVQTLSQKGKVGVSEKKISKSVGLALSIEHELAYNLEILDEPELLWSSDERTMNLYREMVKNFDLNQRVQILEKKLNIISDSNRFLIEQLQSRKSVWLEWIVIILIAVEVVYFVIEPLLKLYQK